MIVARGLATLNELNTVYSLKDLYDLLEISNVDSYNRRVVEKAREKEIELAHGDR